MRLCELTATRKLRGREVFRGLQISIENPKGSVRSGVGQDGKQWSMFYSIPYGYIRGCVRGVDGDNLDCFVGPNQDAPNVFVVHTKNPTTGAYDEDKVMLGFMTAHDAKYAFMRHYTDKKFFQSMDTIPFEKFKERITGTKAPMKITASVGISIGDEVVVDGIKYRHVVKKILPRNMLLLEARGPFNTMDPHTIIRPVTAVTKI